jgi:hypothetical protein
VTDAEVVILLGTVDSTVTLEVVPSHRSGERVALAGPAAIGSSTSRAEPFTVLLPQNAETTVFVGDVLDREDRSARGCDPLHPPGVPYRHR